MHVSPLHREFESADLGDARRNRRLQRIMIGLEVAPSASFPDVFKDPASLEAFYRFTNNEAVEYSSILAPHYERSWGRGGSGDATLVLHDTSFCSFSGETTRVGLPRAGKKQGFHAHAALAVAEGGPPVVHGVVGLDVYTVWNKGWYREYGGGEQDELWVGSQRWGLLVQGVRSRAPVGRALVHVMDREADDYVLMSRVLEVNDDFVIRSKHDRKVTADEGCLSAVASGAKFMVEREVRLSHRSAAGRPPRTRKTHPDRRGRVAMLAIHTTEVEFVRPSGAAPVGEPTMRLWVVEVTEVDPPPGESPVHWRLVTTLPADTPERAARVVDIYRKRWLVEEFFKALKTGCSLEKRQGESLESLLKVLALLVPVAWRLLLLRAMERAVPDAPATEVLDELELEVLRRQVPKRMLPRKATVRHVLLAVARLGGHQPSNGAPGWLILGRGMDHLMTLVKGWRDALKWANARGGNN